MRTIDQEFKAVGSSCYFGGRGHWLIAAAIHRDSGALERSNFEVMEKRLRGDSTIAASEIEAVAIERASHWAVGWIDYLLVNPESGPAASLAQSMIEAIEDYPVLDEEHFSQLETDEADQIWRDCYRERDRIQYIREHRSQFEFRDLADMIACVRGKYFSGYASELCSR